MALALARSLTQLGRYDPEAVARSYVRWYQSNPFDIGATISAALSAPDRAPNPTSQANGALMRISPLGIFGSQLPPEALAQHARTDASLTHPHPTCLDANVVYTAAIAFAIRTANPPERIYQHALDTVKSNRIGSAVSGCLRKAASKPPADYGTQQGWVLIALQNAFYQLLHAPNLEEGIVDTIRRGGDTDTNAAIAGALLGAAWGRTAIPAQWLETLLACRPQLGNENVHRPRPQEYWPVDALQLAEQLIAPASVR
jgi:ADP-ribosylglycohydrolase